MYKDFKELLENMDKIAESDYVEEADTDAQGYKVQDKSLGDKARDFFDKPVTPPTASGDQTAGGQTNAAFLPGAAGGATTTAQAPSSSYTQDISQLGKSSAAAPSGGTPFTAPANQPAMSYAGNQSPSNQAQAAPTGIFSNPTIPTQTSTASAPAKTYGGGYDPSKVQYAATGGKVSQPQAGQAVTKQPAATKTGTGASGFPTTPQTKQQQQNAAGSAMGAGYAQAAKAGQPPSLWQQFRQGMSNLAGPKAVPDSARAMSDKARGLRESEIIASMIDHLSENTLNELSKNTLKSYVPKSVDKAHKIKRSDIDKAEKMADTHIPRALKKIKDPNYGKEQVKEEDMEEGAGVMHFKAQQAKAKGQDSFKLGDKEFPVKESFDADYDIVDSIKSAITRRIRNNKHLNLIAKYGLDKVMDAIDEVAENKRGRYTKDDELGTSDISAFVNQVKNILGDDTSQVQEDSHDYADDRNTDDDARYNLPHTWPKGKKPAKWNTQTGRVSHWSKSDAKHDSGESMIESKKAKPDYLDFDKDGDKKEPMKKALADKKKVKESAMRPLGKKHSKDPDKNPLFKDYASAEDKGIKKSFKNTFSDLLPVKKKDMKPTGVKESSYTPNDADNPTQKPSAANKRYGDLKVHNLQEDAKFQELDNMFSQFLAEEITISSTHNAGTRSSSMSGMPEPEDSVNVSARGEDAKELLGILRNAGIIDSDSGDKDDTMSGDQDISTSIDLDNNQADADFEIEKSDDHSMGNGYGTLQVIQPSHSDDTNADEAPGDMMQDLLAKLTGIGAPDMSDDHDDKDEDHNDKEDDKHDDAKDSDDDNDSDDSDDEETSEASCNECGMYESKCSCDEEAVEESVEENIYETDDGAVATGYEQEEELVAEGVGMIGTTAEGLQNGDDDTALQDIKFLTQTIAGGLNKPKINQHVHPYNNPGPGLSESANDLMKPVSMKDILEKLTKIN